MSDRIEVMTFNGTQEDWIFWKGKFLSQSRKNKYANILRGQVKVPSTLEDFLSSEDKQLIDYHDDGFTDLMIAMMDKKISTEVSGCVSPDHPEGDLMMAWELLCNKFQPTESSDKVLLKEQLMDCKMMDG